MPTPRFRPWIVLALLWAAYFHPLILHPTQSLYRDYSDFASEHLPGRVFLVREWHATGELPLWNPYHFCGSPFVHDIQVGTFYPPYAIALLFHESCAGAVMSWAIALHVFAASAFAFLYARSRGLGEAGSLVGGIGFAYSAKWLTHLLLAGHTITVGLAWLPLALLALESFIRSGRKATLLGGGVAFALLILGSHPQWTFYSGLFVAAWTVPEKSNLGRWALGGSCIALMAVSLAAVQLLPTWEASQHSSRTVGLASQSLVVGIFSLFSAFGPSAAYEPPNAWELRSLLSLFGLAAAIVSPILAPTLGRRKRSVLFAMLGFSFGGAIMVEWLPGFNLFRAASRMLVIAAFPVAFLAGTATDALIASAWDAAKTRVLRNAVLVVALLGGIPSIALPLVMRQPDSPPMWPEFFVYWAAVAVGLALVGAACFIPKLTSGVRTGLWLAALFVELVAPTFRFVEVKPQTDIYPDSPLTAFLNANGDPASARVLDVEVGARSLDRFAPLGIGSPQAFTQRLAMPRGYNPIDVRHYREFLNFVMGSDERVRSLEATAQPIVPNFPRNVPSLWNLLNVRHLVCFDDYVLNDAFRNDPGHRLTERDWRLAAHFETTPDVPALPPLRPEPLPRVLVWENRHFAESPRAFVVPNAARMPSGREFQALVATDLHRTVLLSGKEPLSSTAGSFRPVSIREYRANRVSIDLGAGEGGWLVLVDTWFPGWTCRVDGVDVPVRRANHAFRAVPIPAGAKEAVFRFEPASYRIGWWISAIVATFVIVGAVLAFVGSRLDAFRQGG